MSYAWYDLTGILGVAAIVITYFLLQIDRIPSDSLGYSVWNALGAAAILISLVFDFNLSAALMEIFWLGISVMGIANFYRRSAA